MGLSNSLHQRANDKGAAYAKDYWSDAEIRRSETVLASIRFQLSPAGLDPQSSDYDPNYIAELSDHIASARKMRFVVILINERAALGWARSTRHRLCP